ncbi:APC family permease [Salinisphaera aquimarina]|uniref:APC family permease n=1 Tax=Salinisphaera aquimarina TaxID=2094031 RepID=A0ABV7ES09_9GAMM
MEERTTLERTLKPHWVWAIAFGSAIGWGSFVLPADWMGQAGPLGVIIGFSIGAVLMMMIGVSYGFLIKICPVAGGEFSYAYLGFGRVHAFICGWFLTLGYMAIVALNASAMALLAKFIVPDIANIGLLYSVAGWDVYLGEIVIASLVLIVFAWLNTRGASLSGKTQFFFCVVLIVGAVLVTLGMLFSPQTSFSNLEPLFKPGVPAWSAIAAIVAIAPWAFVGFDNIPQAAEEFDFAPSKAFMLIIIALAMAAVHYSILIIATGLAMPWTDLVSQGSIWGTGDAIQSVLGSVGLGVLALAVCMGIFTGLNGFYISSSRLMFAMSRARILPPVFGKLHPTHRTPTAGIVFTCVICLFAPWFGRDVLLWIVDMSATGVTIAYFYTCAAAYRCFKWTPDSPGLDYEGCVSPARKVLSLIGALSGLSFLGLLLIPGSPGFLSEPSWIALGLWAALGVVFYGVYGRAYQAVPKAELDHLILGDRAP